MTYIKLINVKKVLFYESQHSATRGEKGGLHRKAEEEETFASFVVRTRGKTEWSVDFWFTNTLFALSWEIEVIYVYGKHEIVEASTQKNGCRVRVEKGVARQRDVTAHVLSARNTRTAGAQSRLFPTSFPQPEITWVKEEGRALRVWTGPHTRAFIFWRCSDYRRIEKKNYLSILTGITCSTFYDSFPFFTCNILEMHS